MYKEVIDTANAPKAIGPYSQGIKAGHLVFTSGQLPMDPETGKMAEGIKEQSRRSLENVKAVLEEAGASMHNVVKVTVFLKNMDDFAEMNEVYCHYFASECPARCCVQVAKLPKDALVEIDAIAVI